ncbi:class I SAM-dependent methyltransferase [Rhodococcus koreensis]|uniref:class I SAM-dependent methyltransferase n=1 Tax=Rhodococcus koreensis TaxID=99653 RepID=UPI003670D21E
MSEEIQSEGDISATAVAVAHFRALETGRDDRLFSDPLAAHFVAASGLPIGSIGLSDVTASRVYQSVVARTKFLDDALREAAASGAVKQLVVLGAGLDTRARRLALPGVESAYELDLPHLFSFKRRALDSAPTKPIDAALPVIDVAADLLADDWGTHLVAAGFDATLPTAWVVEGVFIYFTTDQNAQIMKQLTQLSAPGSRLLAVHFGIGSLEEAQSKEMAARTEQGGYGFKSVVANPVDWLAEWGWETESVSIKDFAQTLGREVPYLEQPGHEVAWLIASRLP